MGFWKRLRWAMNAWNDYFSSLWGDYRIYMVIKLIFKYISNHPSPPLYLNRLTLIHNSVTSKCTRNHVLQSLKWEIMKTLYTKHNVYQLICHFKVNCCSLHILNTSSSTRVERPRSKTCKNFVVVANRLRQKSTCLTLLVTICYWWTIQITIQEGMPIL